MRDPRRIPEILAKVERLWKLYPDQRLGQLLANYAFGHHVDPFFMEDDEIEISLAQALKKYGGVEEKDGALGSTGQS